MTLFLNFRGVADSKTIGQNEKIQKILWSDILILGKVLPSLQESHPAVSSGKMSFFSQRPFAPDFVE